MNTDVTDPGLVLVGGDKRRGEVTATDGGSLVSDFLTTPPL